MSLPKYGVNCGVLFFGGIEDLSGIGVRIGKYWFLLLVGFRGTS